MGHKTQPRAFLTEQPPTLRALIDQWLGEVLDLTTNPQATEANTPRNPKFERAAKLWLKGRTCMVCGGKKLLRAHHRFPFHLFPSLEMDESNWRPLCQGDARLNCHLVVGHGGNFSGFNPLVDELAGIVRFAFRANAVLLHAIHAELKARS